MSRRLHILQLVDSLAVGGTENVAVQLSNRLSTSFAVTLGTTRTDGPLAAQLVPDVGRLRLARRGRFDLAAVLRLRHFLRRRGVDLVHAHSSSLFLASLAVVGTDSRLLWHDHFGRWQDEERPRLLYGPPARRAAAVVAVHPALVTWSVESLGVDPARAHYLPNFVEMGRRPPAADLPGTPGRRVVCVANFRAQKNHALLLTAWESVSRQIPDAHLLLVGGHGEEEVRRRVEAEVTRQPSVSLLGLRSDIPAVLAGCDIGVLPSRSEGMPLSLLEYGASGLAVVATAVGGASEILDQGAAGLLVPPGDATSLTAALIRLLRDGDERQVLGGRLQERIRDRFSATASVDRLAAIYHSALLRNGGPKPRIVEG